MINDNKTLEDIEELANLMNEQYKDTPFFCRVYSRPK